MTPEALKRVSQLWDELSALPPSQQAPWLAQLPLEDAVHAEALRHMLLSAGAPSDGLSRGLPDMTAQTHGAKGEPTTHQADQLIGPYRLLRCLGRGGMGEVWLARRDDGLLSREVAIKLPLRQEQQALRQRFEREREILAGLNHPHIARLYDAGIAADGQPFMALEYVQGEPITAYCDQQRLSIAARVALFQQVLEAVQYAHSRLVIHRDIKPSNILVTPEGQALLLDFGIAKLLDQDLTPGAADDAGLTRAAGPAMTLDYASPEQILQQPVGTLSDVYSLGVLLFELLAGERPYRLRQPTRRELEAAILDTVRPLPSASVAVAAAQQRGENLASLRRQLKGDLDTIVLKSLKTAAHERYATVDALAQDLERWRSGQPVMARPDSRWYRSRRFVRRNAVAVSAATLVMVGLSAGLGVALWQAKLARIEAQTAQATEAFLMGLFEANSLEQDDPARAQQTSARDLLKLGAAQLQEGMAEAPEAKLRVLSSLAKLHSGLSLDDQAFELQLQGLKLFEQLHPGASEALVQRLLDVALAGQAGTTHANEAPGYLQRAEQVLNGLGSKPLYLQGRLEQAKAMFADADMCTAATHAQRAVALLRQLPASPDLVEALLQEAQSLSFCGNGERALAAGEEAVQLMGQLKLKSRYADAYRMMSKAEMSLGHMARSFELGRKSVLAAEAQHPAGRTPGATVLNTVASLASGLVACGQSAEALQWMEPRLALALADLTNTDPDAVVSVLRQTSLAQLAMGQRSEALRSLARADQLMTGFDVEPGQRVMVLNAWAAAQLADGQLVQAGKSLDQAWVIHGQLHQRGSTQVNPHIALRIRYWLAMGQPAKALAELPAHTVRPLPSGQLARSAAEHRLLQTEITLASKNFAEALTLADSLAGELERHQEPRYVLDLRARAVKHRAQALKGLGRDAEASIASQQASELSLANMAPPA